MPNHAHSSSLYSASPQSLADQVRKAVKWTGDVVLTFTEVGSERRAKILKDASTEWAAWVPSVSDVGIMWRRDEYDPEWRRTVKLTDRIWTDGKGRKHTTYCASMLLRHVGTRRRLLVSVAHLPSHVQDGSRFHDNAQARAWRDAVDGWHAHWNNVRRRDRPAVGILTGDWNIDVRRSAWMSYMRKVFPSLVNTWSGGRMPPRGKGTHGSRLIDYSMSSIRPRAAALLPDDRSSDHRPFGERIPWN